jgi:hypothetical protein
MIQMVTNNAWTADRKVTLNAGSLQPTAMKVRYWLDNSGSSSDYVRLLVNGTETRRLSGNVSWAQYTDTIPSGAVLDWQIVRPNRPEAGSARLARVELIRTDTNNYAVNDLVEHDGALWSCAVANTVATPGANAEWTKIGLLSDQIGYTPTGGLAATNVQAALNELDTEKAAASHTHPAGTIDTLSDVDTTAVAPSAGDLLSWNGTNWAPSAPTVLLLDAAAAVPTGTPPGTIIARKV